MVTKPNSEVLQPAVNSVGARTYAVKGAVQTCPNNRTGASQIKNKNRYPKQDHQLLPSN